MSGSFDLVFGRGGRPATVIGYGDSALSVVGSNGHDGTYLRYGNTFSGPDGLHMVYGSGPLKTVVGPHGEVHNILETGYGTQIL